MVLGAQCLAQSEHTFIEAMTVSYSDHEYRVPITLLGTGGQSHYRNSFTVILEHSGFLCRPGPLVMMDHGLCKWLSEQCRGPVTYRGHAEDAVPLNGMAVTLLSPSPSHHTLQIGL